MTNEPKPDLLDHVIQKDIVKKLVSLGEARFSEIKPERVESNLFMYHLKQLMSAGIVEKNDNKYALSTKGRMFVDRANLDRLVFRVQPKIVTILVITTDDGKILLLERLHEPHMNRKGFPSGKLHYGETLEEAAARELKEKAGLVDVPLKLAGNVAMRFMDESGEAVMNHTLGYIFTATLKASDELVNESSHWRSYWGDKSELLSGNVFKGHPEILKLLEQSEIFIESLDFESDY